MKWLVLVGMLLVGGVAFAKPPPAFVHEPGMLADVKVVRMDNGDTIDIYLWLVPTQDGGLGVVAKLKNGTVVLFDSNPQNQTAPLYIDRGFCPIGEEFPSGGKPTNDFIPIDQCPKTKAA